MYMYMQPVEKGFSDNVCMYMQPVDEANLDKKKIFVIYSAEIIIPLLSLIHLFLKIKVRASSSSFKTSHPRNNLFI